MIASKRISKVVIKMDAVVIGAGLMGRAIGYDLVKKSCFDRVIITDRSQQALNETVSVIEDEALKPMIIDLNDIDKVKHVLKKVDVCVSAVPYYYNIMLTKHCIDLGVHCIDLGGNNTVVDQQRSLSKEAEKNKVTIIPDCGLAPGIVSIITKHIVETSDSVESVHLRVGGLPVQPYPPLQYELVFSPNGLINEYVEDALVLQNKKILKMKSLTEIESIEFPQPFGTMEAFITSGGCSTLPFTYQDKIGYLDYKTIRYPGHAEKMKAILDLGFGSTEPIQLKDTKISPREMLIAQLANVLGSAREDVVLLRVIATLRKNDSLFERQYNMIDYVDSETGFTAMMRTTGFPVAITADFLAKEIITDYGVFCPEEIIPTKLMFNELNKRNINLNIKEEKL
jgi:lysine 6-dehydrogenase